MLAKSFFLVLLGTVATYAQMPAYSPAGPEDSPRIVALRNEVKSNKQGALRQFWKQIQKKVHH